MCGICGIVSLQDFPVEPDLIKKMNSKIIHRGPNSEGYYINKKVALAVRRLRIIDLITGDQPIFNEDRSICIVFNGEIYNFKELKQYLIKKRHLFYTNSDTEVIVHLYEEYKERCLDWLRGMFAFAIWDENENKLFIARDRIGIKPLYYFINSRYFLFGSELKSILIHQEVEKELDYSAISDFFTFLYVPTPKTIFKKIYKLPPGTYLTVKNGKARINKYWDLKFYKPNIEKSEEQYIEEFIEIFSEAVKIRLISDVPLGVFLSGGIDSNLVVAMMSKLYDKPIRTFSIGYEGEAKNFDERKYSKAVAQKFNTIHYKFILRPEDVRDLTDKIVDSFDEPFADASVIPNFFLSKETRKHVTVALSGLGGDELCAGYERYLGCILAERYRKLPSFFTKKLFPFIVSHIPDSNHGKHFNERLKRFIKTANYPFFKRYFNLIATFNEEEKNRLFKTEIKEYLRQHNSEKIFYDYMPSSNIGKINSMLLIDIKTYLADDLLTLTDRTSMANSLEVRVPFCDHKVIEFFANLPEELKINRFKKKYLLKKVAEKFLPHEIIYRKKMGFSVPLVVWFRNSLKDYVKEILCEEEINKIGFLNYKYISKILNLHFNTKVNYDEKIWSLINFIKWYNKYIYENGI